MEKTKVEQVPGKHIALFSAEIFFSPIVQIQLRQYLTKYYLWVMKNMVSVAESLLSNGKDRYESNHDKDVR